MGLLRQQQHRPPLSDGWEVIPRSGSLVETARNENDKAKRTVTFLIADLLIPGKGSPTHNQAVICEHGTIVHVGPPSTVPGKYAHVEPTHVPVLLPGLWECHAHFVGSSPNKAINLENMGFMFAAEAGARAVRQLKDTLYAGFTSCVDLGGYAPELQKVIAEGSILGPTLYGAGAAITMTAGHGDAFEVPLGNVWQKFKVSSVGTDVGSVPFLMADGLEECRLAVRVNLRRGAKVIKILASGGVTSRDDNPMCQQFSDEELHVMVDEAARMGLICAAHAIGKAGILGAIRAGVRIIEHSTFVDDEVLEAMKKHDVMVVATVSPVQSIVDHKDDYPREMYEKGRAVAKTHRESYRKVIKAGIPCAIGSDLFGGPGSVLSPGDNGKEIAYAVEDGMTPLEAIEAATAHGPLTLGPQAPQSGQIKVGYDADFIGLEKNPLEDIAVLATPKMIKWIWKAGKLVKAPGLDSWDACSN